MYSSPHYVPPSVHHYCITHHYTHIIKGRNFVSLPSSLGRERGGGGRRRVHRSIFPAAHAKHGADSYWRAELALLLVVATSATAVATPGVDTSLGVEVAEVRFGLAVRAGSIRGAGAATAVARIVKDVVAELHGVVVTRWRWNIGVVCAGDMVVVEWRILLAGCGMWIAVGTWR